MKTEKSNIKNFCLIHAEWFSLLVLLLLAISIDAASQGPSFCVLDRVGFHFCPGCGLGRSMALAAQGNFAASFHMHPLGMFAILILLHRIVSILFRHHKHKNEYSYEKNI